MSTNFDFKQIEKELYNFKDYYINEPDLLKRIENCNVKLANYLALNKLIEEDVTISKSDYSILCVKICEIMSDLLGTELKKFSLAIKNPINKLELNHNQKSLDTITNILWSFYRFSYNTIYTHSLLYPKLLGSLHSDAISTNQDLKNKLAQDFIFSTEMELDPTSLKLFHLGFFILNSASIRINPKSFVFNGACDFHNEYFLDFEAIYQLNYNAAASIFDKVFKKNPKFIEAEILRESALLKYSMFEYTDDTRDENIENLELIVKKFPNNAFAHIELAYAYTSISADTEAMQHINSALHICSHSAYLYYRAATMLYRVSRDVQQSKEMILKAYHLNQKNPRFLFYLALFEYIDGKILEAWIMIRMSLKFGENIDNLRLSSTIYSEVIRLYTPFRGNENTKLIVIDDLPDARYRSLVYEFDKLSNEIEKNNKLLRQLELREEMYKKSFLDFKRFKLLNFNDFKQVHITDLKNQEFSMQLSEEKNSIIFCDLCSTYYELENLNLTNSSLTLNEGTFAIEEGKLYLREIDVNQII